MTGAGTFPQSGLKRLIDIVLASLMLLLLLPVMIVAALAVCIGSGRPVLYLQERVGRGGRVFVMYKFRSMRADAEADTGPVWAVARDPRRTAVGAFLRKHNVDELPQLLNVIKGDMSLVGPRPERPFFVEKFEGTVPDYHRRHVVRPGMTGWAQVNGLRGNTSITKRTDYDLHYVDNATLGLDFTVLWLTLREYVCGSSATRHEEEGWRDTS
jgi:exopolysaccharide biosynthesis polyprenyl glycosylphosphotransferase